MTALNKGYNILLYCLYCIALHCTALHCIALHCFALLFFALHFIEFYYIDRSVLLENIPLVKFIKTTSGTRVIYFPQSHTWVYRWRNVGDLSMSFCLYNKKNIYTAAWRYEFYFPVAKIILPLENKIHIFAPPCNILYVLYCIVTQTFVTLPPKHKNSDLFPKYLAVLWFLLFFSTTQ